MTLLRLFLTVSLQRKINEDDLNERDDYGVPFSEQQYTNTRTGFVVSLCLNANRWISLIPPNGLNFRHLLSCGTVGSNASIFLGEAVKRLVETMPRTDNVPINIKIA